MAELRPRMLSLTLGLLLLNSYSALGLADLLCPDFELCNRPYFLKIGRNRGASGYQRRLLQEAHWRVVCLPLSPLSALTARAT